MDRNWIELGDTGDVVKVWQRIFDIRVDGTFGPITQNSAVAWQIARDIEGDGVIGPFTRSRLLPEDLIKPYERLRLQTYDDHDGQPLLLDIGKNWRRPDGSLIKGYPTIGWGRRLTDGRYILTCTRAEADRWFDQMMKSTYMPNVLKYVLPIAAQRCAVASFSYNCGPGEVAKLARQGFDKEQWLDRKRSLGVVVPGLVERRIEEYALYESAARDAA